VRNHGELVAEIPNRALTDEAPVYRRPLEVPDYLAAAQSLDLEALRDAVDAPEALLRLLALPSIASKQWIYHQYDHMVQTNTINLPGFGAGVVRIKGTDRALAMSVDGNGRYGYLDPYQGAVLAVAEASRNVACAGARPLGATNCLNFGNPERPAIMWQFARAVEGIGAACRALGVPITGGNVSLYNETDGKAIYPTPVIGVVGLLEHADRLVTRPFKASGEIVALLGEASPALGASEYLRTVHGLVRGAPPAIDLDRERALQDLLVALASDRLLRSAHDCSDGGIAVALAECTFGTGGIGAEISLEGASVAGSAVLNDAAVLFGEGVSRVVVSLRPEHVTEVLQRAAAAGVPMRVIGETGGNRLRIAVAGRMAIDVPQSDAETAWSSSIGRAFRRRVA
jgi:phosphoribosylformylglycinamidine synthase